MRKISQAAVSAVICGLFLPFGCSPEKEQPGGLVVDKSSSGSENASSSSKAVDESAGGVGETLGANRSNPDAANSGLHSDIPGGSHGNSQKLLDSLLADEADENSQSSPPESGRQQPEAGEGASFVQPPPPAREFPFEIPPNWTKLSETEELWIDRDEHKVFVSGRICLRQGMLEMFACPRSTKEHEAIVATYPISSYVHQALLLVGAEPGKPVQWEPEYQPAVGPKVQIECWFYNENKELVKLSAKEMVRKVADKSPLNIDWVFGGSRFVKDIDGREFYAANGGELICLSNFTTAMIDLPIASTDHEGDLLFEANPEKIPPLDTPVLLVLAPEVKAANAQPGTPSAGK